MDELIKKIVAAAGTKAFGSEGAMRKAAEKAGLSEANIQSVVDYLAEHPLSAEKLSEIAAAVSQEADQNPLSRIAGKLNIFG